MEGAQDKTNGKRKVSDTKDTTAAKNTEAMANAHRHREDHVDTDDRHAPVLNFMANSGLNSGAARAGSDESHSGGCLEQQRRTRAAEKNWRILFWRNGSFSHFQKRVGSTIGTPLFSVGLPEGELPSESFQL